MDGRPHVLAPRRHGGHDRREDRIEQLTHFAQAARHVDGGRVHADGDERHARRLVDEQAEHHDVEAEDQRVEQIVARDRRREHDEVARDPRRDVVRCCPELRRAEGGPYATSGASPNNDAARNTATRPDASVPAIAAISGADARAPNAIASEKRDRRPHGFGEPARVHVVAHHLHAARCRRADFVQREPGHRPQDDRQRRRRLPAAARGAARTLARRRPMPPRRSR